MNVLLCRAELSFIKYILLELDIKPSVYVKNWFPASFKLLLTFPDSCMFDRRCTQSSSWFFLRAVNAAAGRRPGSGSGLKTGPRPGPGRTVTWSRSNTHETRFRQLLLVFCTELFLLNLSGPETQKIPASLPRREGVVPFLVCQDLKTVETVWIWTLRF